MKKLKEFVKKIGNKKRCFLSLLLAGLLLFAVVSGLNGSKSAKTEVNAISAPTTKNLDLNGVRYTYQTSLKELKQEYGFFNYIYSEKLFTISQDGEGVMYYTVGGQKSSIQLNETQLNNTLKITKDALSFYNLNNEKLNNSDYTHDNSSTETNNIVFSYPTSSDDFNLNNISKIQISLQTLFRIPEIEDEYFGPFGGDYGNNGMIISLLYLKNNIDSDNNEIDYLKENSIYKCIAFSKVVDNYTLNLKQYNDYNLRQIALFFPSEVGADVNNIMLATPTEYKDLNINNYNLENDCTINNVNFLQNGYLNEISFDVNYLPDGNEPIYQGNILLSNTNYDKNFITALRGLGSTRIKQNFDGSVFFGGKYGDNFPYGYVEYSYENYIIWGSTQVQVKGQNNQLLFVYPNPSSLGSINSNPVYTNQNQLLYIEKAQTLKARYNNTEYEALSAQVEDVLYNVNYIGNIQEQEFNEKVEDDFTDLLKTTGIGAVIGLLIGFLVGNPIGGLVVGAIIGFAVAIIPLIIDGLQAIFGYDFLSGLYDFFNAITEFFVNIIDKIVGFLLSIITNPFVLILIVIVAILYFFVIRPKIK